MRTNDLNIPILEGEEMWAQEAIDKPKGKYKVSYYVGGGMTVGFRWFDNFKEATDFSLKVKTGDVIEVKWYPNES